MTIKAALTRAKKEFDLIEKDMAKVNSSQHYRNSREWFGKAMDALKAGKGLTDELEEKANDGQTQEKSTN
jgi:hypothetical protein